MKNIFLSATLGATISLSACAGYKHSHDDSNTEASSHDHHSQMMEHHGSHDHQKMMENHHGHSGHGHMAGHHGQEHHGKGHHAGHGEHGKSITGSPGTEQEVDRTIKVEASDSMRFKHEKLNVKAGETIKFEVTNTGAIPHEFSIGTKEEHKAHSKMMMANPNMHHGPGGSSVTVAPGESQTLIWTFEKADDVQVACNIPGHYQAGMHSPVEYE